MAVKTQQTLQMQNKIKKMGVQGLLQRTPDSIKKKQKTEKNTFVVFVGASDARC